MYNNDLIDYSVNTPLRNVTYYNGKLYQITSTGQRGDEIEMGIPPLNFNNPLHVFSSNDESWTATQDCYLWCTIIGGSGAQLLINNKKLLVPYGTICNTTPIIPIKQGQTIKIAGTRNINYDFVYALSPL